MTNNKFWLVWNEAGNAPKKPQDTQEKAITEAKRLSAMYPQHAYIVLKATHHFKADVNIIETSFEATPEESLAFEARFKAGDRVNHWDRDVGIFVQICEKSHKRCVVNFPCDGEQIVNIDDLTLVDNKVDNKGGLNITDFDKRCTPKHKFKVGDRVLLDNYFECIVDDCIDNETFCKLSFMGGGYAIVNKIRVTKK